MRNFFKFRPRDGLFKFGLSICAPTILAATLLAVVSAPLLAAAATGATALPYVIEACPKPLVLHLRRAETAELEGAYQSFEFCGTHLAITTYQESFQSISETGEIAQFASALNIAVAATLGNAQVKLTVGTHTAEMNLPIDSEETAVRLGAEVEPGAPEAVWNLLVRLESVQAQNLFHIEVNAPAHDIARDFSKVAGYQLDGLELISNEITKLSFDTVDGFTALRLLVDSKQGHDVYLHISGNKLRYVRNKTLPKFDRVFSDPSAIDRDAQFKRLLELAGQKQLQGIGLDRAGMLEELGKSAYEKHDFTEGRRLYLAAVNENDTPEFALNRGVMDSIDTITRFAALELRAGYTEFGASLTSQAAQMLSVAQGQNHAAWAKLLLLQADLPAAQANPKQAQALLERALRIATQNGDAVSEENALYELAELHENLQHWADATALRRRLLIRHEHQHYGDFAITDRAVIAFYLDQQGKTQEAQIVWRELADLAVSDQLQPLDQNTGYYAALALRKLAAYDIAAYRFHAASGRWAGIAGLRASFLGQAHQRTTAAEIELQTLAQLDRIDLGTGVDAFLAPPQVGVLALKAGDNDEKWRGLSVELREEFERNLFDVLIKRLSDALDGQNLAPIDQAKCLEKQAEITLALRGADGLADAIQDFSAALDIRQKLAPSSLASEADEARLTTLQRFASSQARVAAKL